MCAKTIKAQCHDIGEPEIHPFGMTRASQSLRSGAGEQRYAESKTNPAQMRSLSNRGYGLASHDGGPTAEMNQTGITPAAPAACAAGAS